MTIRYAIYGAPEPDHPLFRLAAEWLGYDPLGGKILSRPAEGSIEGMTAERLQRLTSEPRKYGFHCTLKAPFQLKPGVNIEALEQAALFFAEANTPVSLGRLKLTRIGRFFALIPEPANAQANVLAGACVRSFDAFRRPADAEELARRRLVGLTPRQDANLLNWGYPHVFDDFRLHFTLSGPVDDDQEAAKLEAVLARKFEEALRVPVSLEAIWLFEQNGPDAKFKVRRRYMLSGRSRASMNN